jgi:hypothetical protein
MRDAFIDLTKKNIAPKRRSYRRLRAQNTVPRRRRARRMPRDGQSRSSLSIADFSPANGLSLRTVHG